MYAIRAATLADVEALKSLIALSARRLSKLYAARGYVPTGRVTHEMEPGLTIEFVPMLKSIAAASRDH